jgi:hypothetical protein
MTMTSIALFSCRSLPYNSPSSLNAQLSGAERADDVGEILDAHSIIPPQPTDRPASNAHRSAYGIESKQHDQWRVNISDEGAAAAAE